MRKSCSVRRRPAVLRALGAGDPPAEIELEGRRFARVEVFKHDSWAATARYACGCDVVVCKFNRTQSIFGFPMGWLGRMLARRESAAFARLAGVSGIPAARGPVQVDGKTLENASAHDYVPGRPLSRDEIPADGFFPALRDLLSAIHARDGAYVDLHKRENIVVGDDGGPHLVDFQVGFLLSSGWRARLFRPLLSALQRMDRFNLAKHLLNHRPDQLHALVAAEDQRMPRLVRAHRCVAVPFRSVRRALLAMIGVRDRSGLACTELEPEDAVRRELAAARSGGPPG